jgi:hypothetical protein
MEKKTMKDHLNRVGFVLPVVLIVGWLIIGGFVIFAVHVVGQVSAIFP